METGRSDRRCVGQRSGFYKATGPRGTVAECHYGTLTKHRANIGHGIFQRLGRVLQGDAQDWHSASKRHPKRLLGGEIFEEGLQSGHTTPTTRGKSSAAHGLSLVGIEALITGSESHYIRA